MDTSNLKNIVVLKNLPSNLVEEAIVVLKENQKATKMQLVDIDGKQNKATQNSAEPNKQKAKDYIVKEAQMLIADYISKVENKNKKESQNTLQKKYQKQKSLNYILTAGLALSMLVQILN